ncbi:hypothetical protein PAXRUDRAFT_170928 [Paxillus rubicundulus Ve08.2h10]|uniref:DUF659 domain-containing protein n=1 Tax=Paxillus rubicundulus Ve08.2h10 TaxID=930991 RepID=A0A0D0BY49_9AGAM|nr:hypothetical protein PAXRUDRAFT_170928 [Paxillus rubicundulus Ve08.2h10]
MARLTVSAGLPFIWVDNPEWLAFFSKLLPTAKRPSQKTLTCRLIPKAVEELHAEVKATVCGHNVTVQADRWTGINNHYLIAFMVTANQKVHTVHMYDTPDEHKMADNLLAHLEEVIKELEDEWGRPVITVVTDSSGESHAAHWRLGKKYPWLIVLDCHAHQVCYVPCIG